MVSKKQLDELFEVANGKLIGKHVDWRHKRVNSRVCGKELGSVTKSGHLEVNFTANDGVKRKMLVHRVIYLMAHNELPDILDHINQDPIDNRIENLRPATKSLNSRNRGAQNNTPFKQRGISLTGSKKYGVYIKTGVEKRVWIGSFSTLEEAVSARLEAEEVLWDDVR